MPNKKENKDKTLVLLDAHAIIHRAYHALPEFLSSKGEPTGALYGLSTMVMKIISELKPDYIVACYDLPQKTFRHEAYDKYKAGRAKADDALIFQLKNSRKIFEAFGIPIYDAKGFEADDVLGTIVEKFKKEKNIKIIIASGDMDTMQLVDGKKVQVYTLKKGINDTILYDEDKVVERFGFPPKLLPDYKGLRGDPSDNIPGIKGIGEKIATILIAKFGTVEEIYKKLKKEADSFEKAGLSRRAINLLEENQEEALFSKTLAKIRRDAPISFELPEKTFWEEASFKKVETVFADFDFRSLSVRLKNFFNTGPEKKEKIIQDISTEEKPFGSVTGGLFGEPKIKVDQKELEETSIALWLLNSDLSNPRLEDILAYAQNTSFEKASQYIYEKLKKENLDKVYSEIEIPIVPIVQKMEKYGVLIDRAYFKKLSKEYHAELDKKVSQIYEIAGMEFNINSPKQLSDVLFNKMGLKSKKKKGASGSISTNISVLEEIEDQSPIIKKIMEHRELSKLLSTYIDVIPQMAGLDGRLHAKFLQNNTTTGRFSSQNPNLQNLPVKSELGKNIRYGFIAPSGHTLLSFDYSQIELRVGAMLSGDSKMTAIFKEKKDIHAGVASFVFGVPIDRVDAEMRRRAKVINFGIIYGMGVSALRKNLGGTREEAQKFYDNYFKQFSGIRDYLENVKKTTEKTYYTYTLFGRRRKFANINSRIPFLKNMAERTAINAPIQGTAADIIKLAIRFADEDLKKMGLEEKAHLILQVHDELIYEVDETVVSKVSEIIKKAMEEVLERSYLSYKTDIPLSVHFGSGKNLGEIKD